jgi:hypothetical protein
MTSQKKAEKIEKITGYALLIVGLILIIVPALTAFAMFLIGAQIPQFVPISPTETDPNVKATGVFANVCLLFFIFIIVVWAGSIITSRAVALIKDVKLHLVRKSLREMAELAEKE